MKDLLRQERLDALTAAIWAHEKGFYLKNEYYNGINLAFLLDCRAAELGGEDAVADRVQARRLRERVVEICTRMLAKGIRSETEDKKERRNIGYVQRSLRLCSARERSPNQTWSLQLPKRQLLNCG
jgi:hypothetical protein